MTTDLDQLKADILAALAAAPDLATWDQVRVGALGKQGSVSALLKTLGGMSPEERQTTGARINQLRTEVSDAIATRKAALDRAALDARLASETLDMSLPINSAATGSIHPVSQVMDELAEIFADLGFAVATGPEIEDDWHNFSALNIPDAHPARAMHDTFYFDQVDGEGRKMLLRTHTSPVQIRTMMTTPPPIRIIAPGRTYRSDSDATHTPMFHQVEGLVIDKGITLGHLKWTLETFVKAYFERDDIVLRQRPSYFPFTEPSVEIDVGYTLVKGKRVIGGTEPDGWMEILGSGMVHPKVIAACGLDPDVWQGFAFGCGIDRLAMLKYGMDDLRPFFDGDLRWLRHYGFAALDVPTLSGGVGGMKFTLSWLKEHLETQADAVAVADALTRIGLEVEHVSNPADALRPFVIAKVLTAVPHPQADKLQVLSVDAGNGPLQVVCGAPNARAGLVGIFGPPGAYVPGSDMTLKVAAIRGVESNGMMCSVRELLLGDEHDGIVELPADAPISEVYAQYAGLDDPLFDIAITPNRQDCMGVRGIARDLAAFGLGTLKPLHEVYYMDSLAPIAGDGPAPDVRTDDAEGCPAFYAQAVSGISKGASPAWMTRKLKAIGQKPISILVDITNFVSIDLGRPLHVYDRAKLAGALVARRATQGEEVLALNGKTYTLDTSMTVIADDVAVHDIGGIMGGEHSGVSDTTTDVLIECAYFDPDHIALTGQKLGLTSDARQRFERGVDPAFLDDGLAIATKLVLDHCGGRASAITRAGKPPQLHREIAYDPALTERLGGLVVSQPRQGEILSRLGFGVEIGSPWRVLAPSWRRDIDGPADLVEEVIRIVGLEHVPATPLPRAEGVAKPTATPEQKLERKARRAAAARGFAEAVTWSFLSDKEAAPFGGGHWTLANPISEDLKVMRPSLIPGLARAAQRNRDRGENDVRLFEVGRRYLADGERPTLGVLIAGDARPRDWRTGKARAADAFDAKAEALAILAAAGAPVDRLQLVGPGGETWHPGRSGQLGLGPKTILATFGELHPETLRALDVEGPMVAAELYLDAIPQRRDAGRARAAFAPPPLQPVRRDFAFLVPADLSSDKLLRSISGADKQAITGVALFDVFIGQGVPEGQKSLGVEVMLQPAEKSFAEADLKAIADRIVAAAAKLGAVLRG